MMSLKLYRKVASSFILCLLALVAVIIFLSSCFKSDDISIRISKYPDGKDFAFTITDDPDYSKLHEHVVIYDFIKNIGMKTSIGVWVLDNKHGSGFRGGLTNTRGMTTNNPDFLQHLKQLQTEGFEFFLHTAGPGNDLREETIKGYELFKKHFGYYPKVNINHANNLEDIYWGKDRFSNALLKFIYGFKREGFQGHVKGSKYFWGDICKEKTKYVRSWATDDINTLSANKTIPYHLDDKPYVNWWFGCSDGYNCEKFNQLISDANIAKLVLERGTCIVYTHLSYDFIDSKGIVNKVFKEQMEKISKLNGWFVPVSTILDRFLLLRNIDVLHKDDGSIIIINNNPETVTKLTMQTNAKKLFSFTSDQWKFSNAQGEIILGDLQPYSVFKLNSDSAKHQFVSPGFFERIKMVKDWILGR